MTLALVFNHDSLPLPCTQTAKSSVKEFIKAVKSCRQYGFHLLLIDEAQCNSLFDIELAKDFFWRDWAGWAKTQDEEKDYLRAFLSLSTSKPLMTSEEHALTNDRIEVGLNGSAKGLRTLLASYWLDTFLMSFPSAPPWDGLSIDAWKLDIDANPNEPQNITLLNIFDTGAVHEHKARLTEILNGRLSSGLDVWKERDTLFPHIRFLEHKFGMQLKTWSHRQDILMKARDALVVINEFTRRWQDNEFSDYQHGHLNACGLAAEVSSESLGVFNNPKKKAERMFWLDSGIQVYCENHVKLPDGFRLHFYPDPNKKIIHIAYLGPHMTL